MIEGYCIDDGAEHYCSDQCLHEQMTDEEFQEMSGEDGTSYISNWYEDSMTYKSFWNVFLQLSIISATDLFASP